MDGRRFDNLARLIGNGVSRRHVLKGLLGLGGAAVTGTVAIDEIDARSRGSRPTIPPPPPPNPTTTTTPAPTTTTANPCAGFVCGLDCCGDLLQCCDGECCPEDTVCLAQVFPEGSSIEEEICCLRDQTCDNQCCDGACFTAFGTSVAGFERTCCPAEDILCQGTGAFADVALCCSGDTPDCCPNPDGSPVCLTVAQCCTDAECAALDDPSQCLVGACTDFTCQPELICSGATPNCCTGGEHVCCVADNCCGPLCCTADQACCARTVQGVLIFSCIDPLTQCCVNADCFEEPFNFDRGCVACPASGPNAFRCDPRNEGESCGPAGECDVCYQGQCLDTPCPTTTTTATPTTTTTVAPTTTTTGAPTTTTAEACVAPDFACGAFCCPAEFYDFCCPAPTEPPEGFPECCAEGRVCDAVGRCCEIDQIVCNGVCVMDTACPTTTSAAPTTTAAPGTTTTLAPGTTTGEPGTTAEPTTTTQAPGTTTTSEPGTTTTANLCLDEGGTPCGETCCHAQCCFNLSGPVCVGVGETCCDTVQDCGLNRCIVVGGQLLHDFNTCSGGICVASQTVCDDNNPCTNNQCNASSGCFFTPIVPAIICNDGNPCTIDTCNPASGCVNSARPPNTVVNEGVCCAGGNLRPSGSICCTTFADCPTLPCTFKSCEGGVCTYDNACSAPNPDCQTASCATGSCVITTDCGGNPPRGQGQQCDFGCQCPSSLVCSSDVFSDPATCRAGGGGGSVRNFCPPL